MHLKSDLIRGRVTFSGSGLIREERTVCNVTVIRFAYCAPSLDLENLQKNVISRSEKRVKHIVLVYNVHLSCKIKIYVKYSISYITVFGCYFSMGCDSY